MFFLNQKSTIFLDYHFGTHLSNFNEEECVCICNSFLLLSLQVLSNSNFNYNHRLLFELHLSFLLNHYKFCSIMVLLGGSALYINFRWQEAIEKLFNWIHSFSWKCVILSFKISSLHNLQPKTILVEVFRKISIKMC